MSATLQVQGFTGHLLALNGQYQQQGDNHGKPTYKKRAEMDGTTQCCVYFWDERDGDALAGWWMAPEVGGEQVWAHCVSKNPTPPTRGWKVPWHTSTPDNRVSMELKQGGFQQQPNQQQFGAKRGFEAAQTPANKFARTQFGQAGANVQAAGGGVGQYQGAAGLGGMKRFPQTNPQQEARNRQMKEKNLAMLNTAVTQAETAIGKLSGAESKEATFDKQRHISMAKSALTQAQGCLDRNLKTGGLDEAQVGTQKAKLAKLTSDLTSHEDAIKGEQKAKLDALKTSYVSDLTKLILEAEKLVEKTKDAAVLFTCEMAEHIKPEEAMEAKEKTDAEATPAAEALKKAKDLMFAKDKELRAFPQADVATIRESVKPLNTRVINAEKELVNVKAQATAAWRKAQVLIVKKKREEEQEKAKAERERVAQYNKEVAGFSYQIGLVADDVLKSCGEDAHGDSLEEAESKLLGLKNELQKRHDNKDCHPQSKAHIQQFIRKIEGNLNRITQMLKEQTNKDQDKVRRAAVEVATATRAKQGEKSDDDFFAEITGKTNKMDQLKFERFLKTLDVKFDRPSYLFKETCKFVSADCSTLDKHAFFLHVANAYHSVVKGTPISKEQAINSEKVGSLELGSVVQVLEGPTEIEGGIIRVKISREKKVGGMEEGYVTLRVNGVENLMQYSPHYTVLSETVLTDTFDLKGFKVVRRIKSDEKFRAVGIPKYNKDSDMWRINGVTEQKENVWVTIQGNRGTSLLRNEPLGTMKKGGKDAEGKDAEEFTEEKLNAILKSMAETSRKNLQTLVDEATEALKAFGEKIKELEGMDEEGKEPSQEEVTELVTALDSALMKQKESSNKAQQQLNKFATNLKTVETGPYAEFKESFPKLQETLTGFLTELKELGEKRRSIQKNVQQKEWERRIAREKAEQEALSEALLLEAKPQAEKIRDLTARMVVIEDELELPKMTDTIAGYQNTMKRITSEVAAVKELGEESKKWLEEKIPVQPKGALITAFNELKKLRGSLTQLLAKCESWTAKLKNLGILFKEKLRVDFAILLKNYLQKKDMDEEKLFKTLAKENETLSLDAFAKFAKHLCKDIESVDDIVKSALGSVKELSKEHLEQLGKVSYRCLKRALVTDIVDIKTCKKLRTLDPEEIISVVDKHVICEKTGLTRFKAKCNDGTEGYVTIRGNKGTTYLKFQQSCYRVIKETVFTDCFEMKNFKVLRRLREGDYLRELSHPQLEEKSGLYRMKAQSVEDNEIGWVTLKGNAGSQFLVNCEMPPPKVEEVPVETEEKKE